MIAQYSNAQVCNRRFLHCRHFCMTENSYYACSATCHERHSRRNSGFVHKTSRSFLLVCRHLSSYTRAVRVCAHRLPPKYTSLYVTLCDRGGRFHIDGDSLTKRRECTEAATRARESFPQTSGYWTKLSIVAHTKNLYEKQKLSRIGEFLVAWWIQLLKDVPWRLEAAAQGCGESVTQSITSQMTAAERGDATADELIRWRIA
jgi:hypothetical protein